jgi:hypothetical protein
MVMSFSIWINARADKRSWSSIDGVILVRKTFVILGGNKFLLPPRNFFRGGGGNWPPSHPSWPANVHQQIEWRYFDLKFCPQIDLLVTRIPWNFQLKKMFLSWDTEFTKNMRFPHFSFDKSGFWKFNISWKKNFVELKISGYSSYK